MSEKKVKSFSVDEDVARILSDRDDINASAVVNKFLREYVAGGRGEEAALEVRLNELDNEIAELEKQLQQKKRERNRVEEQLSSRQDELREQLHEVEQLAQENPQFWDGDPLKEFESPSPDVDPEHEIIQKYAAKAGVPAERFADELEARL